jgi:hypothetical protein
MCLSIASWRFRSLRSRNGAHSRMRGKGKQGRRAVKCRCQTSFLAAFVSPFLSPRRTHHSADDRRRNLHRKPTMLRITETELAPLTGLWKHAPRRLYRALVPIGTWGKQNPHHSAGVHRFRNFGEPFRPRTSPLGLKGSVARKCLASGFAHR